MGAWALGASVLFACSSTGQNGTASGTDSASGDLGTMVAALSVNSDGTDPTWSDPTDPEPVRGKACGFERIVEKVVARFDANGDGSLDASERGQIQSDFADDDSDHAAGADAGVSAHGHLLHGRAALLVALYDTNADGTLDATEIATLKADIEARCEARLAKLVAEFDTNGDGTLDDSEWKAADAALHASFEAKHTDRIKAVDTNGDGKISLAERQAAREVADQARGGNEEKFDADGDGKLGDSEQARFRDHGRKCVRDDLPMGSDDSPDAGGEGHGDHGGFGGGSAHVEIGAGGTGGSGD
jgi:hypothetical protein